ncbi:MAG: metallophosphoesterase [Actinomycetota bacterium]
MTDSTARPVDLTTVTDRSAVIHATGAAGDVTVHRVDDLPPGTTTTIDVGDVGSIEITTLATPPGELLAVVATVNDLHFGEVVAGQIDDLTDGPLRRSEPGAEPYPELMNRAAVDEISAIEPDAVVVKGDLSLDGTDDEWAAFERCYRTRFGRHLHVVRGNHDAYRGQDHYAGHRRIDVDGLTVALLDTVIPEATTGRFDTDAADWLDDLAAGADRPVMAMGHHQQWIGGGGPDEQRSDGYFGLHPDDSDRLDDVIARREAVLGYSAGHTHRHRRRTMRRSGVPSIEVGCVKDFPGTWAEHRVYEGGVMHVVHRISDPAALRWSESCRVLYSDFGVDYETYALGVLADRCFVLPVVDGRRRLIDG